MRIAFYAPLKSPNHPNPSGDRLLARSLMDAMKRAGHEVMLSSEFRSFEKCGDTAKQHAIRAEARAQADRLIARYRSSTAPHAWFTYHVYHKAPDWIGPRVSQALGIPYIVAEASLSPRQEDGPWQEGHRQTVECLAHADAMIVLNRRDIACTAMMLPAGVEIVRVKPFIDPGRWLDPALQRRPAGHPPRLVAVAMMRAGDKEESWSRLAEWLAHVPATNWTLEAVGDGVARGRVEARLRGLLGKRVHFHGRLEQADLRRVLDQCHLFVWPSINEAFGMAFLEAQARGLAVVAGRHGGVADVVCHGIAGLLSADTDDGAGAGRMIHYLIERPKVVERMGNHARQRISEYHNLDHAARTIDRLLRKVCAKSS